MNKHYDVETFEKFLNWKQKNGDDIDNWEMSGLKEAVKEFKKYFPHALNFDLISDKSKDLYFNSASRFFGFLLIFRWNQE